LTTILFQPKRTGSPTQSTVTGKLPPAPGGGTPSGNFTIWEYWSVDPGWDVTKLRGKWNISVKFSNNTIPFQQSANFKIDKRDQIVKLANSWIGGTAAQMQAAGASSGLCGGLTSMVYNQLGLGPLSSPVGTQLSQASVVTSGKGSLAFYCDLGDSPWEPSHVAIVDGSQRININSNTTPGTSVVKESINDGVVTGTGNPVLPYRSEIRYRSSDNLDAD
jgi:hypothetical protein